MPVGMGLRSGETISSIVVSVEAERQVLSPSPVSAMFDFYHSSLVLQEEIKEVANGTIQFTQVVCRLHISSYLHGCWIVGQEESIILVFLSPKSPRTFLSDSHQNFFPVSTIKQVSNYCQKQPDVQFLIMNNPNFRNKVYGPSKFIKSESDCICK